MDEADKIIDVTLDSYISYASFVEDHIDKWFKERYLWSLSPFQFPLLRPPMKQKIRCVKRRFTIC